jgi:hypothetical protein
LTTPNWSAVAGYAPPDHDHPNSTRQRLLADIYELCGSTEQVEVLVIHSLGNHLGVLAQISWIGPFIFDHLIPR